MGRPDRVQRFTPGVNAYDDPVRGLQFNAAGQMTSLVAVRAAWNGSAWVENPVTETRQYNVRGQMKRMTAPGEVDLEYRFSAAQNDGRITQMKDWISGEEEVNYQYDSLGRLTSAVTTGARTPKSGSRRRHMKTPIALIVAAYLLPAADVKITSDLQSEGVRYRSLTGQMSRIDFEKVATALLSSQAVKLGAVDAYPSVHDRILAGPQLCNERTYDGWQYARTLYKLPPGECPEVQQAVKLGSDIIYRSVDRRCQAGQKLLRGNRNPLLIRIGDAEIEVLQISFGPPGMTDKLHRMFVELYGLVTYGEITEALARALAGKIRNLAGTSNVGVTLRSDTWFIGDCNFPLFYGFGARGEIPPTKESFLQGKMARCWGLDPGGLIRCW